MKLDTLDLSQERSIVTNLIVSTEFLRDISPLLKSKLFKSSYAKHVATWILEYYERYKQSPQQAIQDIFIEHKPSLQDEDAESIGLFLTNLSKDYDTIKDIHNIEYITKRAIDYLNIRSLELLKDDIDKAIQKGDATNGQAAIANYTKIDRVEGTSISIMHDHAEIFKAFNAEMDEETLFAFPGALGKICSNQCRGDLMAWMAPPKRGKSFALWYSTEQILAAGHRVVFFSLEMRMPQMVRRAWQSLTGRPKTTRNLDVPFFMTEDSPTDFDCKWEIGYKNVKREGIEDIRIEAMQKQLRMSMHGADCRIICLPTNSATLADIIAHLDNLEFYEGFIPDAVGIDYADLLKAPKGGSLELRHQLNSNWLGLRGLAQERNIYIYTASQTNRAGMSRDIEAGDAAEDIRRTQHVSTLLGLNQTHSERERGIIRAVPLLQRDEATSTDQAVILQSLGFGKFYLDSRCRSAVNYKSNAKKGEEDE